MMKDEYTNIPNQEETPNSVEVQLCSELKVDLISPTIKVGKFILNINALLG